MLLFVTGYSCLMSTQLHEHKQPPYKKTLHIQCTVKICCLKCQKYKIRIKTYIYYEKEFQFKLFKIRFICFNFLTTFLK